MPEATMGRLDPGDSRPVVRVATEDPNDRSDHGNDNDPNPDVS
jgi:hypothetical protein